LTWGESRTIAWPRRPQAAALVAQLADPDRGWDTIVVREYERAFYGSQYAAIAPLFEHYGVQLSSAGSAMRTRGPRPGRDPDAPTSVIPALRIVTAFPRMPETGWAQQLH
jgi:hypothetical protein